MTTNQEIINTMGLENNLKQTVMCFPDTYKLTELFSTEREGTEKLAEGLPCKYVRTKFYFTPFFKGVLNEPLLSSIYKVIFFISKIMDIGDNITRLSVLLMDPFNFDDIYPIVQNFIKRVTDPNDISTSLVIKIKLWLSNGDVAKDLLQIKKSGQNTLVHTLREENILNFSELLHLFHVIVHSITSGKNNFTHYKIVSTETHYYLLLIAKKKDEK